MDLTQIHTPKMKGRTSSSSVQQKLPSLSWQPPSQCYGRSCGNLMAVKQRAARNGRADSRTCNYNDERLLGGWGETTARKSNNKKIKPNIKNPKSATNCLYLLYKCNKNLVPNNQNLIFELHPSFTTARYPWSSFFNVLYV